MKCWLYPAQLLYFHSPPQKILVRAEPLPAGVNPRWTPRNRIVERQFGGPS
jgi:hypothetical protein